MVKNREDCREIARRMQIVKHYKDRTEESEAKVMIVNMKTSGVDAYSAASEGRLT